MLRQEQWDLSNATFFFLTSEVLFLAAASSRQVKRERDRKKGFFFFLRFATVDFGRRLLSPREEFHQSIAFSMVGGW